MAKAKSKTCDTCLFSGVEETFLGIAGAKNSLCCHRFPVEHPLKVNENAWCGEWKSKSQDKKVEEKENG